MHEPATTPEPAPQLVRAIGRWSLAALTVNSIIGSGIFGLPSLIAGLVGRASPWVYLLAAAGMGIIMACFAEVASRFTGAGGPYLYARVAFGRFVGIQMGWLSWLVRVTAAAANANLFTIYLAEFWPGAKDPLPRVLVLTALITIITAINYGGVKQGTHVSNVFTAGKLIPLAILIIAGLNYLATGHHAVLQPHINANAGSWLQATLLLVFAYGGFEGALMPLGEARNPRRDAPFALFTALATCTLIYTLIQVVVMAVLVNPQSTDRPLATAAHHLLGPAGGGLIALGALISVYGYLAAHMINAPRLTYALAEHGDIPPIFAAIHARFRTPHVSIVIFGVAVWALAFWGNFTWNVILSAASRLFTFAVVCAAVVQLRRTQPDRATFSLPAGTLFAILGIVFSLVLITRMGAREFLVLAITALISFLNWLWARRTHFATSK
jgi:basic amino acid/polyamine antiporter, APA family